MATIILSACVGYRTRHSGYETVTSLPFHRIGERETIEAANLTAVRCAVAAYGARLQAEHPDASFLVLVSVARESRKPNGFDATRRNGGFACNAWLKHREETPYAPTADEDPAGKGAGA